MQSTSVKRLPIQSGFLVAFGGTGYRSSAGRLALFMPGGLGGMFPWELFKIVLSKMQFPAFPGLELVNGESLLRHQKLLTKN